VPIQRPYNADPSKHRRSSALRHQDQRLHCGLPLRRIVLLLRQRRDVLAGIAQRRQRATFWQQYGLVKLARPSHPMLDDFACSFVRSPVSCSTSSSIALRSFSASAP
jgi:hypothetical protein